MKYLASLILLFSYEVHSQQTEFTNPFITLMKPSEHTVPLVVNEQSSIIVMQYMPWFGVLAHSFKDSPVNPILQSEIMTNWLSPILGFGDQKILDYGGYSSNDRNVLRQHIAWLKQMGVHAIALDNSNGIACAFGNLSIEFCSPDSVKNPAIPPQNFYNLKSTKENIEVVYDEFSKDGSIKIIPLMGGQEPDSTNKMSNGKIPLEEQVIFYQNLMSKYPNLSVIYEEKPLVMAYLATDASLRETIVLDTLKKFNPTLTIKTMGGFFDSYHQEKLYKGKGLQNLNKVTHWSWWDSYNPAFNIFPTYADKDGAAESFTVSMASPTRINESLKKPFKFIKKSKKNHIPSDIEPQKNIWGVLADNCIFLSTAENVNNPNCRAIQHPDVLGFRNGETAKSYFELAKKLKPTFLFIHAFNAFTNNDGGLDIETMTDIEPTFEWGNTRMIIVTNLINDYKNFLALNPKMPDPTLLSPEAAKEYLDLNLDVKKAYENKPANDYRSLVKFASDHYNQRSASEGRPRSVREYLDCNPDIELAFWDQKKINNNQNEENNNLTAFVAKHFQDHIQPKMPVDSRNFKTFGCMSLEKYLTCYSDVRIHCSNENQGKPRFVESVKFCAKEHIAHVNSPEYKRLHPNEVRDGVNGCN